MRRAAAFGEGLARAMYTVRSPVAASADELMHRTHREGRTMRANRGTHLRQQRLGARESQAIGSPSSSTGRRATIGVQRIVCAGRLAMAAERGAQKQDRRQSRRAAPRDGALRCVRDRAIAAAPKSPSQRPTLRRAPISATSCRVRVRPRGSCAISPRPNARQETLHLRLGVGRRHRGDEPNRARQGDVHGAGLPLRS